MKGRRSYLGVLSAALLGAMLIAFSPAVATADGPECGSKENPCPLQKWMRANLGTPLAGGDTAALAAGLNKVAAASPDASWNWSKIANDGAAAAAAGDVPGAKAACKSCHDAYKGPYKERFRTRPAPN